MSREVELKSVVDDVDARRRQIEASGARLVFAGRLEDRRYDTPDRSLAASDHVLRLRVIRAQPGDKPAPLSSIDWKGPTQYHGGYKVREELSSGAIDADAVAAILGRLGYVVTREIDREVSVYELGGATVRFERYPRMDPLVEVEGEPEAIEYAISVLGLERAGFTTERLPEFVARFEARTGTRAAICDRELAGDFRYEVADA